MLTFNQFPRVPFPERVQKQGTFIDFKEGSMAFPQSARESKDQLNEALHLHIKKSQWGQAIEVLGKLTRLEPGNATYLLRTGDYFVKLGGKEKAIAAYMSAGQKFSNGGFLVKGIAAYKMALQVSPNHEEVRKRLQALHAEAKQQTDPRMMFHVPPPSASAPKPAGVLSPEEIAKTTEVAPSLGMEPTALPDAPAAPSESISIEQTTLAGAQGAAREEQTMQTPGIERTAFEIKEEAPTPQLDVESTSYAESVAAPPESIPVEPTRQASVEEMPVDTPLEDLQPTALPAKHLNDVIPLFANLTQEDFSWVVEKTTAKTYLSGEPIVREGETGDSIYIIIKGQVKVTARSGVQEVILGTLGENDFFGEVAFLTGRPRTADVIATAETEILELPGSALRELVSRYPRIQGVLESFYVKRVKMTIEAMKNAKGAL
jgi:hypothetical protein